MRGDRRADRRKGSPGFPSSSFYGGQSAGGLDAKWQGTAMCVCSTGSGRSGKQGRGGGPLPVGHMMPRGNLMSVCRAGSPQGAYGAAEESRGGKTDRSGTGVQKAHSGEKERWPSSSGGLERRKERPCGRSRCMQDDAGRLQRLTGDNVRPLMRPAQRREEAQGGSTQRGA